VYSPLSRQTAAQMGLFASQLPQLTRVPAEWQGVPASRTDREPGRRQRDPRHGRRVPADVEGGGGRVATSLRQMPSWSLTRHRSCAAHFQPWFRGGMFLLPHHRI